MPRLLPFLLAIDFFLKVYCFIDCIRTPPERLRYLNKYVWMLVIALISPAGWIAWLAVGHYGSPGGRFGQQRPRPIAPDDDPDFLRGLG